MSEIRNLRMRAERLREEADQLDERARLLEASSFTRRVESCGCWTVVDGWFTRVHHCDRHRRHPIDAAMQSSPPTETTDG